MSSFFSVEGFLEQLGTQSEAYRAVIRAGRYREGAILDSPALLRGLLDQTEVRDWLAEHGLWVKEIHEGGYWPHPPRSWHVATPGWTVAEATISAKVLAAFRLAESVRQSVGARRVTSVHLLYGLLAQVVYADSAVHRHFSVLEPVLRELQGSTADAGRLWSAATVLPVQLQRYLDAKMTKGAMDDEKHLLEELERLRQAYLEKLQLVDAALIARALEAVWKSARFEAARQYFTDKGIVEPNETPPEGVSQEALSPEAGDPLLDRKVNEELIKPAEPEPT